MALVSQEESLLQKFSRFMFVATAGLAVLLAVVATAKASDPQLLIGHVPQAVADSRVVQELPRFTRLNLAIGLSLRNQEELDSLLKELADPASPEFGHYLSAQEFADEFGPTEQDYQALIRFVKGNGLVVTGTHPNRVLLDVSGDVPDVERLLHVNMMVYNHPVRGNFYAPDREPWLDCETKITDITGLDNFEPPHPMSLKRVPLNKAAPYVTGSGPWGYFIGRDFRAAYAPGVSLTGSGQAVGLLEFDGFFPGDVTRNFAQAGLPAVPTQTVLLDGFNGSPGGGNIEVILDIMMASYMAPGLSKVLVYEGYYPNDVLNRMATDNAAHQLSSSWGFPINGTTEQIFKEFIAQGQSLMQASGDSGAYRNGVMTPSDDPNLTVVGGTSLTTSSAGGPWEYESAWSGSGGGISTTYGIPSYQQGLDMAANGGSPWMRNIPDVALTADVQIFLIADNGESGVVGGTSAAAPLWAGFIALANQQAAANAMPKVGFLNPRVYALGTGANYTLDLHDVTTGSNGYPAVTGYDLATGWGSPAGKQLIYDLTGTTGAVSFALSSSASSLSIKPAGTASATLSVTGKNSFNGSVNLSVSGLPSGVTAVFSPASASTTTTSKVTFTATSSVTAGTYPLTITGTSGSLTSTAQIGLTAVVPSFSLSASPANLNVPQASSASSTISVSGQNGFSGSVSLSASGLPSGVTAAFSPATASTTTKSKVTFTATSSVPAGSYPVTINGTSGSLSASTQIGLTVVVPSFSLSASSASITAPQGGSASSTVSVSGQNLFSGSVSLSASGLPSGVTAAFSPATATTTTASKVRFTVSSSVAAGSYPITITGASGSLSGTAQIGLTVVVPSFSLSASATTLNTPQGSSASSTISVNGQNLFSGNVSLSASGLPSGVTAVFSPASTTNVSTVTFAATGTATAGTFTVAVNGVSGSLTNTVSLTLTVFTPTSGTTLVNLSTAYDVTALVIDGVPFTGGGLDGGLNGTSTSYSANLVGQQQIIGGTLFYFGPPGVPDAVSGKTVSLPAGKFSSIKLLGTAVQGAQISQLFKVKYTDGSASTFYQNLSDWYIPEYFSGETEAIVMSHRDTGPGQIDNRTFYLYEYVFSLNASKTVASITLPNNRNVVILAATLTNAAPSVRSSSPGH